MIEKTLSKLEHVDHPLLGPTLWGLKKWGMWQPKRDLRSIIYNLVHIIAVIFVISQYVELWLIRSNLDMALRNLSVTMLSSICVIKAGTFVFWQKDWKNVIEFVSELEKRQLSKKDKITDGILSEYRKYSRRVTCFYWALSTATVLTVIVAPLVGYLSSHEYRERLSQGIEPYPEIISSWLPFEKTRGIGYWFSVVEDILICFYGGGIVAIYDSNAIVLMSFFAGQLKLLSINCSRLFDKENHDNSKTEIGRIGDCHHHHKLLVKYSKALNSLLSPVMFLYVIICSLMICASAIQITTEGTTSMQRIWIAEYLMALIAQLFFFCWHSNEVLAVSNKVDDGVYKSSWSSQNIQVRRNILLLGGQLRKSFEFTAGPFTKLNLHTFSKILKGSYSYYTLLSNKED